MKLLTAVSAIACAVAILASAAPAGRPPAQEDVPPMTPRLAILPPARMLVVEVQGDPALVSDEAFNLLFTTFYHYLPGARLAPPRVRFLNLEAPRDEWVGLYAVPLPETVQGLALGYANVRIEIWDYGTVAEVLHPGAYADEESTLRMLFGFIEDLGYVIAGPHEEIYLTGLMNGARPEDFRTIIRYRVDPGGVPPPPPPPPGSRF